MDVRRPNQWTTFAIVAIGVLMATIDSSIVNISLPIIARDFGAPLGGAVEWVIIGYLVTVAALLLTAGRLSDSIGRRRSWAGGLVLFTAGSALCGAAPSLALLVAFRALQGIGGALVMAVSPAILVSAFPTTQRGRALGLNAVVVGLGVSLGPTLGGVITQHLGWRWIFYVNVPLGAVGCAATLAFLHDEHPGRQSRLDATGAALLAVGLGAATGTLSFVGELGAGSIPCIVGALIASVALAALAVRIRRSAEPIIEPSLFHNRVFTSATISLLLATIGTFSVALLLPFYFEQLRGWPPERTGLLLTPLPLTVAVVSPWTGSLADRIGTRGLAFGGMLVAAAGLGWLAFVAVATPVVHIVAALVLIGTGRATFQPPNNSALMGSAPRDRQGVAAGMMATTRVMGQSLSVAMAGALFTTFGGALAAHQLRHASTHAASPEVADAFLRGMRSALIGCAVASLAASIAALVRGQERGDPSGDAAKAQGHPAGHQSQRPSMV